MTNIPRPSNKIHSPLKLGLTLVCDSKVQPDSRPLNCYLHPSSSSKGVLACLHHLPAISTLRAKTWQNHKPVCHMSTSPELASMFSLNYYKHWAPPEPKSAASFLNPAPEEPDVYGYSLTHQSSSGRSGINICW